MPNQVIDLSSTTTVTYNSNDVDQLYLNNLLIWEGSKDSAVTTFPGSSTKSIEMEVVGYAHQPSDYGDFNMVTVLEYKGPSVRIDHQDKYGVCVSPDYLGNGTTFETFTTRGIRHRPLTVDATWGFTGFVQFQMGTGNSTSYQHMWYEGVPSYTNVVKGTHLAYNQHWGNLFIPGQPNANWTWYRDGPNNKIHRVTNPNNPLRWMKSNLAPTSDAHLISSYGTAVSNGFDEGHEYSYNIRNDFKKESGTSKNMGDYFSTKGARPGYHPQPYGGRNRNKYVEWLESSYSNHVKIGHYYYALNSQGTCIDPYDSVTSRSKRSKWTPNLNYAGWTIGAKGYKSMTDTQEKNYGPDENYQWFLTSNVSKKDHFVAQMGCVRNSGGGWEYVLDTTGRTDYVHSQGYHDGADSRTGRSCDSSKRGVLCGQDPAATAGVNYSGWSSSYYNWSRTRPDSQAYSLHTSGTTSIGNNSKVGNNLNDRCNVIFFPTFNYEESCPSIIAMIPWPFESQLSHNIHGSGQLAKGAKVSIPASHPIHKMMRPAIGRSCTVEVLKSHAEQRHKKQKSKHASRYANNGNWPAGGFGRTHYSRY